jgi:hypothetical protein
MIPNNTTLSKSGWKFCRMCKFYALTTDILCKCCKKKFRVKRRNSYVGTAKEIPVARIS